MFIALMMVGVVVGGIAYEKNVRRPKNRLKALEASLNTLADHNVDIACRGSSTRIQQLQRRPEGPTSRLSVTDVLDRDSKVNRKGDWKRLEFHEGFHQGPFDDELTDEEWAFVHQRYPEMLEEKTARRLSVQSHQRHLNDSEVRMERLAAKYMEEAKRITSDRIGRQHQWDQEFNS